jgi:hypothetical protein
MAIKSESVPLLTAYHGVPGVSNMRACSATASSEPMTSSEEDAIATTRVQSAGAGEECAGARGKNPRTPIDPEGSRASFGANPAG